METVKLSNNEAPIVRLGQPLTDEIIEKLIENGVKYLWVQISPVSPPVVNAEKIEELKHGVKEIFTDAAQKMKIDKREIQDLSNQVVNDIVKNFGDKLSLIFLIQQNDEEYTYVHEVHVGMISSLIGLELGMPVNQLSRLAFSAMIHDIGKILVPKDILYAPRRLSEKEFEMVKKHVEFGGRICKNSGIEDQGVLSGVTDHHEKLDGTGYLKRLTDPEITLFARIIGTADIYDALISNRSYKSSWSPYKAISELIKLAAFRKLDKKVVQAFVSVVGLYPVGTTVILSSGEKGVVVGNTINRATQPIVLLESGEHVDLAEERNLTILEVLD
ncbi:HD-GYP domain-containing protein [Pseudothermotoga sp. U03pept]|uniref:HD-GYP domain-containing protein n=1 Tax=Pseudothermotoga sp. U03pept TaxID=3447012 RepID=UPI003EFFDEC7